MPKENFNPQPIEKALPTKRDQKKAELKAVPEEILEIEDEDIIEIIEKNAPMEQITAQGQKYELMAAHLAVQNADAIQLALNSNKVAEIKKSIAATKTEIKKIPEDIDFQRNIPYETRKALGDKRFKLTQELKSLQEQHDHLASEITKLNIAEDVKTGSAENIAFKQWELANEQQNIAKEIEKTLKQQADIHQKTDELKTAAAEYNLNLSFRKKMNVINKNLQQNRESAEKISKLQKRKKSLETKKMKLLARWDKNETELNRLSKAEEKFTELSEPVALANKQETLDIPEPTPAKQEPPVDLIAEPEEVTPVAEQSAPAVKEQFVNLKDSLTADLQAASREFEELQAQLNQAETELQDKYKQFGKGFLGIGKKAEVKAAEKQIEKLHELIEDKSIEIKRIKKNIDKA